MLSSFSSHEFAIFIQNDERIKNIRRILFSLSEHYEIDSWKFFVRFLIHGKFNSCSTNDTVNVVNTVFFHNKVILYSERFDSNARSEERSSVLSLKKVGIPSDYAPFSVIPIILSNSRRIEPNAEKPKKSLRSYVIRYTARKMHGNKEGK